jgi:FG-GAP-like repeat
MSTCRCRASSADTAWAVTRARLRRRSNLSSAAGGRTLAKLPTKSLGLVVMLCFVLVASAGGATSPAPRWGPPVLAGTLPADAAEATEVLTVDLNGDGLRDVVVGPVNTTLGNAVLPVAPVFLLNRGNGRFADATQQLLDGPAPMIEWDRQILTADFNRDGKPDIFIADHGHVNDSDSSAGRSGAQQHLILSTADGHVVDATGNLPHERTFTHSAAVADVNGDGASDIFENNLGCCSDDHVQAQLLLNDGSGHFTVAPEALQGVLTDRYGNDHSYACLFADVNGDGSPDLVLGGSEDENASQVLLNDGHGHFTFFETLPPTIGPPNNAFVIDMKAADINGDGAIDLAFAETLNDPWYVGTNIQVVMNDGHGHFTDETSIRLAEPPTEAKSWPDRILLEDVNGDGRPDLTVAFAPAGVVPQADPTAVYLNDGAVFRRITAPKDGFGSAGGGIGYINGDGPHALFSVEFHPLGQGPSRYYVTPQLVRPPPPTGLRATRSRAGVLLRWARVSGALRYELRRNRTLITTTKRTSYLDRNPGRHPTYTVRSVNTAGTSADSAPARP